MGAHTLAGTRKTRDKASTSLSRASKGPSRRVAPGILARDVPVLVTALGGLVFGLSTNVLVIAYALSGGLSV